MKTSPRQTNIISIAYSILTKEFPLEPDEAKHILFKAIVQELHSRKITLVDLENAGMPLRIQYVRSVSSLIQETLVTRKNFKKDIVSEKVALFMQKYQQQNVAFAR
jgi:hypothetical protein